LQRLVYQFSNVFIEQVIDLFKRESTNDIAVLYETIGSHCFDSTKAADKRKGSNDKLNSLLSLRILLANDTVAAADICISYLKQALQKGFISMQTIQRLLTEGPFIPYGARLKQLAEEVAFSITTHEREKTIDLLTVQKSGKDLIPAKNTTERHFNESDDDPDKFVYVDHAGLVLLHPFFSEFFFSLALIDEQRRFINEESQLRAIYLLSFLATGKTGAPEPTLPFCKFLCGMPIETAIVKDIALSKYESEECEQLLNAVITHWSALKNTSPDGLREGFLNRKGKLDFRESMTALFVESKPQDVLLEKLPWGISYVQLPWLEEPFTTTWN